MGCSRCSGLRQKFPNILQLWALHIFAGNVLINYLHDSQNSDEQDEEEMSYEETFQNMQMSTYYMYMNIILIFIAYIKSEYKKGRKDAKNQVQLPALPGNYDR